MDVTVWKLEPVGGALLARGARKSQTFSLAPELGEFVGDEHACKYRAV